MGIILLSSFDASIAGLTMCQKERQVALGWKGIPSPGSFVPTCRPDGGYNVVQCHPSLGVCWCVDKDGIEKQGSRTDGEPSCGLMGESVRKWTQCASYLHTYMQTFLKGFFWCNILFGVTHMTIVLIFNNK